MRLFGWLRRRREYQPFTGLPAFFDQHVFRRVSGDTFRCDTCGQETECQTDRDIVVFPSVGNPHLGVPLNCDIEVVVPPGYDTFVRVPAGEWRRARLGE